MGTVGCIGNTSYSEEAFMTTPGGCMTSQLPLMGFTDLVGFRTMTSGLREGVQGLGVAKGLGCYAHCLDGRTRSNVPPSGTHVRGDVAYCILTSRRAINHNDFHRFGVEVCCMVLCCFFDGLTLLLQQLDVMSSEGSCRSKYSLRMARKGAPKP